LTLFVSILTEEDTLDIYDQQLNPLKNLKDDTTIVDKYTASVTKKPSSKKYNFRQFQEKAAELFKASDSSVEINNTAYACLVSLVSISRQSIHPRSIKQSFTSIIKRNSTIFSPSGGGKEKPFTNYPLPAKGRSQGRPTSLRKRSSAEVFRTGIHVSKKKREKPCCGFCKQSTGHKFFQCEHLKKFGSPVRLKGEMLTIWIDNIKDPKSLHTPSEPLPPGSITEKKPLLQSIPKETFWLVIERKCVLNTSVVFMVTFLGDGGLPFKDEYQTCCVGADTMIEWIRRNAKNSNHVINGLPVASVALASQLSQPET